MFSRSSFAVGSLRRSESFRTFLHRRDSSAVIHSFWRLCYITLSYQWDRPLFGSTHNSFLVDNLLGKSILFHSWFLFFEVLISSWAVPRSWQLEISLFWHYRNIVTAHAFYLFLFLLCSQLALEHKCLCQPLASANMILVALGLRFGPRHF